MCRHVAYLGDPTSPGYPVLDAPHSLRVQAHAPHDMRDGGTVNADGFGVAWHAGDGRAVRYRRARPLWTDDTAPRLLATTTAEVFLAAVRSATPGMPAEEAACAPFTDERWMFSHNGVIRGWPSSVSGLAEKLPVADLLELEARTDSALLWALLRRQLAGGTDPVEAVADVICDVERAAPGSRLNLVLAGAGLLVATAWTHALSVRVGQRGVLVASEPVDAAPDWQPVPDRHLVVARQRPDGPAVEIADLDQCTPGRRAT